MIPAAAEEISVDAAHAAVLSVSTFKKKKKKTLVKAFLSGQDVFTSLPSSLARV